jgi:gluconolactonase
MMKRRHLIWIGRVGIIGFVFLFLFACAGTKPQPQPVGFVAPGATWQEVSHEGMAFGEGVVAAPNGIIYFSSMTRTIPPGPDNPGGTIFRYDPATGQTTKYMEPSGMSNGLHIDRNGDMLIAQDSGGGGKGGGRAIVRRNLTTGATTVVADNYQGKHFNGPNDLTADSKGRVYFTDARYGGTEPMELPNAVYRVDLDGKVTQLSTDILRPNGIEVSPDGKRLYVAASNAKHLPVNPNGPATDKFGITLGGVVVYDLDSKGNISNGRLFFRNDVLLVDGMTMDSRGNLYLAMHNGNGNAPDTAIMVLNPEGQIVERIPTPEKGLTTNLGFGRAADAGSLYVTTAFPIRLYKIKTLRQGHYF